MIHQDPLSVAVEQATRLNHEGVRCMAANDSQSAHLLFKEALATINGCLAEDDNDMAMNVEEKANSKSPSAIPSLSLPISGLEDDLFYVHSQALSVDFGVFGSSTSTLNLASIVVIFNMALCCHQHGMICHVESNLFSASRLYGMCSLLVGQQEQHQTAARDLAALVAMAAMNNKAQIHYQYLADQQGAAELLKKINLPIAVPSCSFLEHSHLDEILLNRHTLGGSSPLPSAAAA